MNNERHLPLHGSSLLAEVEGPLPPYTRILDFLPESELQRLFDWTLSIADRFRPATVSRARPRVDAEWRIALTTAKIGPLETMLRERLLGALPQVMAETGTGGPTPTSLELELAAHGDGAYYRPHMDIPVGANRRPTGATQGEDRVLSAVYYFHAEPQAFSGGQLRLFRFGTIPPVQEPQPANHVDLEPVRNSLVAFPSWVPHEVRQIRVPTGDLRDYRLALTAGIAELSGRSSKCPQWVENGHCVRSSKSRSRPPSLRGRGNRLVRRITQLRRIREVK